MKITTMTRRLFQSSILLCDPFYVPVVRIQTAFSSLSARLHCRRDPSGENTPQLTNTSFSPSAHRAARNSGPARRWTRWLAAGSASCRWIGPPVALGGAGSAVRGWRGGRGEESGHLGRQAAGRQVTCWSHRRDGAQLLRVCALSLIL